MNLFGLLLILVYIEPVNTVNTRHLEKSITRTNR